MAQSDQELEDRLAATHEHIEELKAARRATTAPYSGGGAQAHEAVHEIRRLDVLIAAEKARARDLAALLDQRKGFGPGAPYVPRPIPRRYRSSE